MQEDRGLKDILLDVLSNHKQKVLIEDDGNRVMLKGLPGLAYDVALGDSSMSKPDSSCSHVRCTGCRFLVSRNTWCNNCDYYNGE